MITDTGVLRLVDSGDSDTSDDTSDDTSEEFGAKTKEVTG